MFTIYVAREGTRKSILIYSPEKITIAPSGTAPNTGKTTLPTMPAVNELEQHHNVCVHINEESGPDTKPFLQVLVLTFIRT